MLLQIRGGLGSEKDRLRYVRLCALHSVAKPAIVEVSPKNCKRKLAWQMPFEIISSSQSLLGIDIHFNSETIRLANSNTLFKQGLRDIALATSDIVGMAGTSTLYSEINSGETDSNDEECNKENAATIRPVYSVNFIGEIAKDYLQNKNSLHARTAGVKLIVKMEIKLPLIRCGKDIELDIYENKISVKCVNGYGLELHFAMNIDVDSSTSVYQTKKKKLVLHLPINCKSRDECVGEAIVSELADDEHVADEHSTPALDDVFSTNPTLTEENRVDNHIDMTGPVEEASEPLTTAASTTPVEASEPLTPIEVVHTRAPPKLNGILKRRSRAISECSSSDDVCGVMLDRQCSIGSGIFDSGLSEAEQQEVAVCFGGRRKTVSFSEYIEQTMFKKNQSVTTMRTTLKNKKKRARRRQQKEGDKLNNGKPNRPKANGGCGRASKSDEDADENDDDAEEADDDSGIHSCDDALLSNGVRRSATEADGNDTNDDDEDDSEAEVASAPAERQKKSPYTPASVVSSAPSHSGKGRRHAKKTTAKH